MDEYIIFVEGYLKSNKLEYKLYKNKILIEQGNNSILNIDSMFIKKYNATAYHKYFNEESFVLLKIK